MKLETFFEKFDQFADAPDAVAKMRELVLELAVQGRLTSAFPRDGAVPSVVELRESAAALANSLGLRSPKESVEEAEPPFDVPSHWRWMALADIGAAQTGTTPSKADHDAFNGDVPFIKPADILPNSIDYSNESLTRHGAESGSRLAPSGSLLMVCIGTIGKCNLIERECAFNQQINSLTPVDAVDSRYLLVAARSRSFQDAAWKKSSSTTIAILNKGKWLSIPVPLPPLAEQKRIVAKVDELMALCDRLALQQQERETRHAALARASLARFADAPTPANLTFLFHPSYAIPPADLRKSILTLAVQGKLVPQDPNDELVERIIGRNDRMRAGAAFEIPDQWVWKQLSQLADINGGFAFKSTAYTDEGWRVVRISDFDEFGFKDHKVIRHPFTPDLQKFALAENSILMAMTGGTVGKSYFVRSLPEPMVVNQRVATIKVSADVNPSYVDIAIRSEMTQEVIRKAKNSTNDNISMGDIKGFTIPLPPLAEQRRIVAKVEQLMALVDALELQLAASRAAAENLLAAIVAELTEGTHASPAC
jgi:type I restriction enzyme S subunit